MLVYLLKKLKKVLPDKVKLHLLHYNKYDTVQYEKPCSSPHRYQGTTGTN